MSRSNCNLFDATYHDDERDSGTSHLVSRRLEEGLKGVVGGVIPCGGYTVGTFMLDTKKTQRIEALKGWRTTNVQDDDVLPTPDYDSGELTRKVLHVH